MAKFYYRNTEWFNPMDKCKICQGEDINKTILGGKTMVNSQVAYFLCEDSQCKFYNQFQVVHMCCLNWKLKQENVIGHKTFRERKLRGDEGLMMMRKCEYVSGISCLGCKNRGVSNVVLCDNRNYINLLKEHASKSVPLLSEEDVVEEESDEAFFERLLGILTQKDVACIKTPWDMPAPFVTSLKFPPPYNPVNTQSC